LGTEPDSQSCFSVTKPYSENLGLEFISSGLKLETIVTDP